MPELEGGFSPILAELGVDASGSRLAFYPSSGIDLRPPAALRARLAPEFPELAAYIYVDRRAPWIEWLTRRWMDDVHHVYDETAKRTVHGQDARVFASLRAEFPPIIAVQGDNRELYAKLHEEGIHPAVFIGISDGCRVGGNPACVCRLDPGSVFFREPAPRWWVVDHFDGDLAAAPRSAERPREILGRELPGLKMTELGLIDSDWGNYEGTIENPMAGATLFEKVKR